MWKYLNPREREIINFIRKEGKVRVKDIQKHLGITRQQIHKYLNRLEAEGFIKKIVERKGNYFVPYYMPGFDPYSFFEKAHLKVPKILSSSVEELFEEDLSKEEIKDLAEQILLTFLIHLVEMDFAINSTNIPPRVVLYFMKDSSICLYDIFAKLAEKYPEKTREILKEMKGIMFKAIGTFVFPTKEENKG